MSVSVLQPSSALPPSPPRKRTSSFSFSFASSSPRPAKAPRTMGALRRTESTISLLEPGPSTHATVPQAAPPSAAAVPYHRSLQYQKDQRTLRRKQAAAADNFTALPPPSRPAVPPQQQFPAGGRPSKTQQRSSRSRTPVQLSTSTPKRTAPAQVILPSATSKHAVTIFTTMRTTSPLSPVRAVLPGRPIFPRSKTEPDLYKKALISRMKQTEQGKRILCMGPRLAISVWSATQDLEKIVADQHRREKEFDMILDEASPFDDEPLEAGPEPAPPILTSSWVVVRPNEDWEMVDCASS